MGDPQLSAGVGAPLLPAQPLPVQQMRPRQVRQRGQVAVVIRFVSSEIPPLDSLNVAPVLADLDDRAKNPSIEYSEVGPYNHLPDVKVYRPKTGEAK